MRGLSTCNSHSNRQSGPVYGHTLGMAKERYGARVDHYTNRTLEQVAVHETELRPH
jgi:hypothetical protein